MVSASNSHSGSPKSRSDDWLVDLFLGSAEFNPWTTFVNSWCDVLRLYRLNLMLM